MNRPIQAVVASHFSMRTGLIPFLLITVGWSASAIFVPDRYVGASLWYIATAGFLLGFGLRLHLTSYRAYLVPRMREVNRNVLLGILLLTVLMVLAIGSARLALPLSLPALWLVGLTCFYVAGLSKNMLATVSLVALLGAMVPFSFVLKFFPEGLSNPGTSIVGVLSLAAVLFTRLVWRRVGALRGPTWAAPGGQVMLWDIADRSAIPKSLDSMTSRLPDGLWGRARHFELITTTGRSQFYVLPPMILAWAVFASVSLNSWSSILGVLAFSIPMTVPITSAVVHLAVSPRTFLLPLSRTEIVKYWGTAVFVSIVKFWALLASPYVVLLLVPGISSPVPLPFLIATTLVAQLPLFGATMAAHSVRTTSGIRYSMFLLPVFLALTFVATRVWAQPTVALATFLASIVLGPILIWFSYRRWCNTEVG